MSTKIKRLFILGFPGLYGGAGTELHHQIIVWRAMGIEVHLIPCDDGYRREPLFMEMLSRGVYVHSPRDWSALHAGDPILSFCNGLFLDALPEIRRHTKRTVFINCMTWLFDKEKEAMQTGLISMFLYQNEDVKTVHQSELRKINPESEAQFMTFVPYFDAKSFPFIDTRSQQYFGCGRISRQDADKFSADTLRIYEYFVSPTPKRGLFLGFDARSESKIGKPYDWIRVARDQHEVSQQEFYRHCEIILQPTDTTENWPRVGLEAMSSGSVLVVDNRGGWRRMVDHGKTGFLCDNERDFIYYASRLAYEPTMRADMAHAARERCLQISGMEQSMASWDAVLTEIAKLPE